MIDATNTYFSLFLIKRRLNEAEQRVENFFVDCLHFLFFFVDDLIKIIIKRAYNEKRTILINI